MRVDQLSTALLDQVSERLRDTWGDWNANGLDKTLEDEEINLLVDLRVEAEDGDRLNCEPKVLDIIWMHIRENHDDKRHGLHLIIDRLPQFLASRFQYIWSYFGSTLTLTCGS